MTNKAQRTSAYRAAIASAQATLRAAQALNQSSNAVDFYLNAIAARETFNAAEAVAYAKFSGVSLA